MKRELSNTALAVIAVFTLTVPWLLLWLLGLHRGVSLAQRVALSGVGILGAAFLLAWAAETAEEDVPRSFAVAVLAVVAVLPEYAVDALYAFQAGVDPGSPASERAADLAIANMTGANRILIGIGWSAIALYAIYVAWKKNVGSVRDSGSFWRWRVELDRGIALEFTFLAIATLYAFFVPFRGGIDWLDFVVLVGLYGIYIVHAVKSPVVKDEHIGVPRYLAGFRRGVRVPLVIVMFIYSGFVILVAVEPFAHGLEALGPRLGLDSFYMIQWVAPLASETPEFIVAGFLVYKARSTAAMNTLISSKLNQWTLLIGTLVLVYSISLGYYDSLSFGFKQSAEIWLTAAQSFFALAIIVNLNIEVREAVVLLILFMVQLHPFFHTHDMILLYTALYMVLGVLILALRWRSLVEMTRIMRSELLLIRDINKD